MSCLKSYVTWYTVLYSYWWTVPALPEEVSYEAGAAVVPPEHGHHIHGQPVPVTLYSILLCYVL